jgi:hypothetical protein
MSVYSTTLVELIDVSRQAGYVDRDVRPASINGVGLAVVVTPSLGRLLHHIEVAQIDDCGRGWAITPDGN